MQYTKSQLASGVDFLEYLQSEDAVSRQIYEFAVRLIRTHFDLEDDPQIISEDASTSIATHSVTDQLGSHFTFGINSRSNSKPTKSAATSYQFEFWSNQMLDFQAMIGMNLSDWSQVI